jgi:hypothetical protein
MLDDAKKLPSFSNEPQAFANMTLFLSERYGLALHVRSGASGMIRQGEDLAGLARYYSDYETHGKAGYEPMARAYLASVNQTRARRSQPPLNREEEKDFIKNSCAEMARLYAEKCEDSHDLSDEFCAAAKDLGAALQARVDGGVKRITIIQSWNPAENFMKPQHG